MVPEKCRQTKTIRLRRCRRDLLVLKDPPGEFVISIINNPANATWSEAFLLLSHFGKLEVELERHFAA